jgi:hypothetical protein
LLNYVLNGLFVYKKRPKFLNVGRKKKNKSQSENNPKTADPLPDMEA